MLAGWLTAAGYGAGRGPLAAMLAACSNKLRARLLPCSTQTHRRHRLHTPQLPAAGPGHLPIPAQRLAGAAAASAGSSSSGGQGSCQPGCGTAAGALSAGLPVQRCLRGGRLAFCAVPSHVIWPLPKPHVPDQPGARQLECECRLKWTPGQPAAVANSHCHPLECTVLQLSCLANGTMRAASGRRGPRWKRGAMVEKGNR